MKQFKIKQKNKKEDFLVLLGTWGASLLGNMLAGRGINRAEYGSKVHRSKGDGIIRTCYGSKKELILITFN